MLFRWPFLPSNATPQRQWTQSGGRTLKHEGFLGYGDSFLECLAAFQGRSVRQDRDFALAAIERNSEVCWETSEVTSLLILIGKNSDGPKVERPLPWHRGSSLVQAWQAVLRCPNELQEDTLGLNMS